MSGAVDRAGGGGARRGLFATASLILCGAGIVAMAYGLAVPVEASIAQYRLERQFEERMAAAALPSGGKPSARAMAALPDDAATRPVARVAGLPRGGPIARISVERLGVTDIILAGDPTHERLARAPTMLKLGDAASPVTILAAHRDTHFLFIRDLREGDDVMLQLITGETRHYRVKRFETVRWDEFSYPLDPARPLLALTTCYPFGGTEYGGPLRRVAWAEQII